ncbi:MAG: hypothetical protein JNK15_06970 [Planctomycetes bacterium]|nr:hypothetical protein [Planctomycetota bacterium]
MVRSRSNVAVVGVVMAAVAVAQAPPQWRQLPPIGPFLCRGMFVEPSGSIVVLGGVAQVVRTWRWSGTWSEIRPDPAPPTRGKPAFAYDTARGVGVLFGGAMLQSPYAGTNDTWEFDGAAWTLRALPLVPPARFGAALGYDPVRQRLVLFGGQSLGAPLADTWEYDGVSWVQVATTTAPLPQSSASMAWHDGLQALVLVGMGPGTASATWTWNGAAWSPIATVNAPQWREEPRLAHDPVRGRTVLFGGFNPLVFNGLFDDTWEFDGSNWTQVSPTTVPRGRVGVGMAWSPQLQAVVQMGGPFGGVPRMSAAMHAFAGVDWNVVSPEAPFLRNQPWLAFDSARDRLVLHGGSDENGVLQLDTWEWGNGAWQQTSVGIGPDANLVYDPDRQCIVAVQGGVTWEYRASGWLPRNLVPAPASGPVWFDRHTRRVRCGVGAQLWTFDGNAWSAQSVVGAAPAGFAMQAVHWSARDLAIASAPNGVGAAAFDGVAWQPFALADASLHRLVEDVLRGALVVNDGFQGRTWWNTGSAWNFADHGPAEEVFDVSLVADPVGGRLFGVSRGGSVWRLEWPTTASLARYGRGCAGSAGVPRLDPYPATTPLLGATVPMQLLSLPFAPGFGLLALGDSIATANGAPLPIALDALGLPGCRAWIPVQATALFVHSGAFAQLAVFVPAVPALAGLPFGLQAFVFDPASPNGFGAVSNSLILIAR